MKIDRMGIDVTQEPWKSGAEFLAGKDIPPPPNDNYGPKNFVRRVARTILRENNRRRRLGIPLIDYMSVSFKPGEERPEWAEPRQ